MAVTVAVVVEPGGEDAMLDVLLARGADAVDLDDTTVYGLFAGVPDLTGIAHRVTPAATSDWGSSWMPVPRALRFGPISIGPPGVEAVITLEASAAFGTGLHPTTALVLDALVAAPPQRVLDVGTGSGILALVAAKLGATVVATDLDPEALAAAARNAALNGLLDRIRFAAIDDVREQFPLVVANILAGPLVDLAPVLIARVAATGRLVLSGIRSDQADRVAAAYRHRGMHAISKERRGDWVCLEVVPSWSTPRATRRA